ncbi:hypothetical protein ICV90_01785 [Polynucleobacter sp. JS-JIR-II-b4]|nr:hypothetical protein ICV90_01785 [Polynucleobacter sp. JS-JIR-II-b4]
MTPFEDWTRGWSKIIFLLTDFIAIYLLIDNRVNRYLLFALGLAFGKLLTFYFNPNIYAIDEPWKFGYGAAITILAVIYVQLGISKRSVLYNISILIILAFANIFMGFRSLGAVCLATAIMFYVLINNQNKVVRIKFKNIVFLLTLGIISFFIFYKMYEYMALSGLLGAVQEDKFLNQSSGDFGFLLGGRNELFASVQAVIDSPLIGHGSWAKDPKYRDIMFDALIEHGYISDNLIINDNDLIPSHSHIMGAWVEAGLMGALFWIWTVSISFKTLSRLLAGPNPLFILASFFTIGFIWDIIFSPLGAEARVNDAFTLSLMIYVLTYNNKNIKKY